MEFGSDNEKRRNALARRVENKIPLLLDGATGTELERRGHHAGLPLWSSHALHHAPEAIFEIHRDYVLAGAEVLTANTFRTQSRVLAKADDLAGRAQEFTELAVALARRAADASPHPVWVAGSAPPLEDCYRPDWVPDAAALDAEHREHAAHLSAAGVDLILVETMNCISEARAATRAASETGLPVWVSFICNADARLLSNEPLCAAIESVREFAPSVLLVNCLPPSVVERCLVELAKSGAAFGVYANLGAPYPNSPDKRREDHNPQAFAEQSRRWVDVGASVVGGCCGTTPEHIGALRRAFDPATSG